MPFIMNQPSDGVNAFVPGDFAMTGSDSGSSKRLQVTLMSGVSSSCTSKRALHQMLLRGAALPPWRQPGPEIGRSEPDAVRRAGRPPLRWSEPGLGRAGHG